MSDSAPVIIKHGYAPIEHKPALAHLFLSLIHI